jgi:hypothetical protein
MSNWTTIITMDLLVEFIIPHVSSSNVEHLFITEKRIYDAMKEKEYSNKIWKIFWTRLINECAADDGYYMYDEVI